MAQLDPPLQMWPIDATSGQGVIGSDWLRWFLRLYTLVNAAPGQQGSTTSLTRQSGALTDQTVNIPALASGQARVNWYLEETAADGQGSTIQVTIGWTHNAKPLTRTFAALTTDSVYANASATIPILVDQNSPVTYSIAYASTTGATQYSFSIWVDQ